MASRVVGPIEGDAWGQALLAGVDGHESVIVVERDDGLIEPDPFVSRNYFGEPDSWSDRDHWAIERTVGTVLDVGAGAGRATLALQAERACPTSRATRGRVAVRDIAHAGRR